MFLNRRFKNLQEKKEKINKIIENWQFRRLTLLGKITVIKSLLASQLVYILSPLPTPSEYLKEINSLLYKFLWDKKMLDIKTEAIRKLSNFKSHWTKIFYQNNLKDVAFFFTFFESYGCNLLSVITPKTISYGSPRK